MAARGRPFEPGNKFGRGRPRGSRNKTTMVAQQIMNNHADPLVRKALVMAMQGDTAILRAFLDRILPVRKETPVKLGTLPMATIPDILKASKAVLEKVTSGKLTITEAQGVTDLFARHCKVIETEELEQRILALESKK